MKVNKRYVTIVFVMIVFFSLMLPIIGKENENEFTIEELDYIKANPNVVTAIDPEFSPYEFIDSDGLYKGIAADYIHLIEKKTGLKFVVLKDVSWAEAYDLAIEGKVDVLPCVGITSQRKQFFDFSDVYESFQRVLLSRADDKTYSFKDLEGLKIGVQRNSSHYGFLNSEFDNIEEPLLFENNDRLILGLMYGDIDVAITNYAASRYRIKELGVTNIKVDEIYDVSSSELAMAVRKDSPVLLSIINKGLRSITIEEKTAVQNKWLGIEKAADYSVIIFRIVIASGIIGVFIIFFLYWNITLKKEIKNRLIIEEELELAKLEAEDANAAKSIFLARMSHEIRTPLNAISGLGYLLENTTTSTIQERYIKSLKTASYNLLSVVNDILDFSKIEAGEVQIEMIEFNLDSLLEKVSTMLIPKANEKEIGFHVIKSHDLKDRYISDPTKIEQILINLLNNAIKFTNKGDVQIKISQTDAKDNIATLVFHVCDTGIGISKDQLSNLFIPFHQLDASITRTYGGTGLGLSICKHLVELLGGTITVESVLDQGTCFNVMLPLQFLDNEEKKPISSIFPDLGNIRVLLYDENQISREITKDYLEAFLLKVVVAKSPNEVVAKLQTNPPDYQLLILNISMKQYDALDIVEGIIREGIHVILLANKVQETMFNRAEAMGVKHIIMQPVIESILYNSIIQCFSETIKSELVNTKAPLTKVENKHILLVEDNEVNQMIANEILTQKGYHVKIAVNGLEAVECMKAENVYDVILMDIHMPIMDGYEATKMIREFNKTIPIIAMTAISVKNLNNEVTAFGMNDWITKPIEPEELFIKLQNHTMSKYDSALGTEIVSETESVNNLEANRNTNNQLMKEVTLDKYLNIKQGMKRINNNEKLYYEILSKFYDDMKETNEELADLVKNKKYIDASKVVHKVKGCSGNVGALQLFQSSKILMDAIKSGVEPDIAPYLWEFDNDMKTTLESIEEIMRDKTSLNVSAKKTHYFDEELKTRLVHLRGLLNLSDIDAFKEIEDLDEFIPKHEKEWIKLKELCSQYNFKEALVVLDNLIK